MSSFLGNLGRFATGGVAGLGIPEDYKSFFMGTPPAFDQRSRLGESQQPLYNQLIQAAQGPGAGGALGNVADYYRNLLSNDNADIQAFAAPELRRYNQETIPGLARQFAGFGAGGALNGAGFRNAALNASTDLGERIAAIRAGVRQQGAQGLQGIGQLGLGDYFQNIFSPRQPGLLENILPALIKAAVGYATGGPGGAATGALSSLGNLGADTGIQQGGFA